MKKFWIISGGLVLCGTACLLHAASSVGGKAKGKSGQVSFTGNAPYRPVDPVGGLEITDFPADGATPQWLMFNDIPEGGTVRYTLDGSEPTEQSQEWPVAGLDITEFDRRHEFSEFQITFGLNEVNRILKTKVYKAGYDPSETRVDFLEWGWRLNTVEGPDWQETKTLPNWTRTRTTDFSEVQIVRKFGRVIEGGVYGDGRVGGITPKFKQVNLTGNNYGGSPPTFSVSAKEVEPDNLQNDFSDGVAVSNDNHRLSFPLEASGGETPLGLRAGWGMIIDSRIESTFSGIYIAQESFRAIVGGIIPMKEVKAQFKTRAFGEGQDEVTWLENEEALLFAGKTSAEIDGKLPARLTIHIPAIGQAWFRVKVRGAGATNLEVKKLNAIGQEEILTGFESIVPGADLQLVVRMKEEVDEIGDAWVEVYPGPVPTQSGIKAKIIPVPELAVDANRDGEIHFMREINLTPEKREENSDIRPYRFWVNDDFDGFHTSGSGPYEKEILGSIFKDSDDFIMGSMRDLEDFSRLWIHLGGLQEKVANGQILVGFKWKNTTDSPSINIFEAVETDGGTQYLADDGKALQQLVSGTAARSTIPNIDNQNVQLNSADAFIVHPSFWQALSAVNSKKYLLFEGCDVGNGQLVLTFHKPDGTEIGEGSNVWMDVKNIKKMYQRAKAQPEDIAAPNGDVVGPFTGCSRRKCDQPIDGRRHWIFQKSSNYL
jgi:hypothetical protein